MKASRSVGPSDSPSTPGPYLEPFRATRARAGSRQATARAVTNCRDVDDPDRAGAAQPRRFDPSRAARLDDPARFAYLPVSDIIALLELGAGARLLDFGAGTGAYVIAIARERPDLQIFALDEQPEMLAMLHANLARAGAISTVEALLPEQLPSVCGTIDRILAINVLHELGDSALATIAPLLHDAGSALFADWNGDVERSVGPPREHVYGVTEAVERLARAGLRTTASTLFPFHFALRCVPTAATASTQRGGR